MVPTGHGADGIDAPDSVARMTDAAHTGRAVRAGIPSVLEPIRAWGSRVAVLLRQRALHESASLLPPIPGGRSATAS